MLSNRIFAIFVEIILSVLEAGNTSAAFDPSDIWEGGKSAKLNRGTLHPGKKTHIMHKVIVTQGSALGGIFTLIHRL